MRKQDTTFIGTRLGRLIVLGVDPDHTYRGETLWLCQCDCGTVKSLRKSNLLRNTRSCGCFGSEMTIARHLTHGMSHTPEHVIWSSLKNRCLSSTDMDYARYGGRGITVCPEWLSSFEAFYADMGPRPSPKHSIDRIDVDGPYSPENCRWATCVEQARNRRSNTVVTYRGETMPLIAWSEKTGLSYNALKLRMKHGWSIERMLTQPVRVTSKAQRSTGHD